MARSVLTKIQRTCRFLLLALSENKDMTVLLGAIAAAEPATLAMASTMQM
ncbi:hypothetical protein ACEWPM_004725 [Roseovarius sp. S4756]